MELSHLDFVTYCIGLLSERLSINQPTIYRMLRYSGLLENYILPGYDFLHTFGKDYLASDLIEAMKEKQLL